MLEHKAGILSILEPKGLFFLPECLDPFGKVKLLRREENQKNPLKMLGFLLYVLQ